MDKSTLNKINAFTRRELTEKELYVFPVHLCDNNIDRDGECFDDDSLVKLKELFVGKTGIFDHDPRGANQSARIFDTEIVSEPGKTTKDGRPYKYLKGMAYMMRTDNNKSLIDEIDGGIKKEVSISCSANKRVCSICGTDRNKSSCEHIKGNSYNGMICYNILKDITDAYEWSFVAVPAQVEAGVTKKYSLGVDKKEEKSMDFKPITTQAEFDAAVKLLVDAAVADAKKAFENWLSPEAAATLRNERDDFAAKNHNYEIGAIKTKVAAEKGIPIELAPKLAGETEEDIRKDADVFAKHINKSPKYTATPKFIGDTGTGDAKTNLQLKMLEALETN